MARGYKMLGVNKTTGETYDPASEATQVDIAAALTGMAQRPNGVLNCSQPEAGVKTMIGEVANLHTQIYDRSPFFKSYAEVLPLEIETYFTGSDGPGGIPSFVPPDFEFIVCENATGQAGSTYPVAGSRWLKSATDPFQTIDYVLRVGDADLRTAYIMPIRITPLAATRIFVRAIPSGIGTLTQAGVKFRAPGITLL